LAERYRIVEIVEVLPAAKEGERASAQPAQERASQPVHDFEPAAS
jgi:hypothetical protein